MGNRKHLGLLFTYNEGWIGGTYYLLNLVHALNTLPENEKPLISIISPLRKDFNYIQLETNYPYLKFIKLASSSSLFAKAVNAITLRTVGRKFIDPKLTQAVDLLFSNPSDNFFQLIDDSKKVYWIPDFQEVYLPDYFNINELIVIKQRHIEYAYRAKKIVFSSFDSKKDFQMLYPNAKADIFVLPFCVTHKDFSSVNFEQIAKQFNIVKPYFYAPNQFWAHKNHIVVIEAIRKLKEIDENVLVIFSGKESDPRSPRYTTDLKKVVNEYSLEDNVLFLGFLNRLDQLCLFANAQAIIQPSLFEGWSTVIEDAKALNKKIIASNLNVHIEQLTNYNNYLLFDPHSCSELLQAILKINTINNVSAVSYAENRQAYAKSFMKLFD